MINNINERLVKLTILFYPLFYLGIGGKYPWAMLGGHGIQVGMLTFFSCSSAFVVLCFLKIIDRLSYERLELLFYVNLICASAFILLYDVVQFKHFQRFGYQKPLLLYFIDVLLILFSFVMVKIKIKNLLIIISFFYICHSAVSIVYFPLVIERSDMFAAILGSIQQFSIGLNPYAKIYQNVGIPPYLPLTILSFYPAVVFKIDPRYVALFYSLITILLILYKINLFEDRSKILLCLLFMNPYWLMRHDLYYQLFMLELVVVYCYFQKMREITRIIFLGIFICTLQFAWIIYPFILLAYSSKLMQVIRQAFFSLLIALCITFYYTHGYVLSFYNAIFLHQEYLGSYSSDITFGLSTIFYFAKTQVALYLIQVIGCLAILGYFIARFLLHKHSNRGIYLAASGVCYGYFMITNYFIETYLLIPVLLSICLCHNYLFLPTNIDG